MIQETAEQNTNNQLKSSNEKEQKIQQLKSKQRHGQFCRDLERPSVYQENLCHGYVAQASREKWCSCRGQIC